jgi:serine/threonine protein kinase
MTGFSRLLEGKVLNGRYRIDRLIGKGGMGAVFRGSDLQLDRGVAVKVLSIEPDTPEQATLLRARFRREAKAAAKLRHSNVVTLHDFGSDEDLDVDFIVMELLQGEDAQTRIQTSGPIPWESALHILYQAACGLGAGHLAGLIHRDVKPSNIFLEVGSSDNGFGRALILDFGIAQIIEDVEAVTATHLTMYGSGPLTPSYASPEQLRGERLTPASDVFALGLSAYELLTGERLRSSGRTLTHPDPAAERAVVAHLQMLPSAAVELIAASLSYYPGERPKNGSEFAQHLAEILARSLLRQSEPTSTKNHPSIVSGAEGPLDAPRGVPAALDTAGPSSATVQHPLSRAQIVRPHTQRRMRGALLGGLIAAFAVLGLQLSRGGWPRPTGPQFIAPERTPVLDREVTEIDELRREIDGNRHLRQRSVVQLPSPRVPGSADSARTTVYDEGGVVRKIVYVQYRTKGNNANTYYYQDSRMKLTVETSANGREQEYYFVRDSVIRWEVNGRYRKSSGELEGYNNSHHAWLADYLLTRASRRG